MDRRQKLYGFIKDFWQLIKKHLEVPAQEDQVAWDRIVEEAGDLLEKYKTADAEGAFMQSCLVAWLEYMNKRNKESMNG